METFKQGKVTARIDERGIDLGNINVNLYTMDNSTAALDIHIKKRNIMSEKKEFIPINLNQTKFRPVLHLITEDNSVFTNEELEIVKAEEGHVRYNVSDYVTKHVGRVQAKLFLIDEDSSTDDSSHVADFYFKVNDSGLTKAIGKEIHVDMLDDIVERILLKDIERFRGPKGDKGDTGPKGDKGDKGADGINGEIGPVGPRGHMGIKGDTGEQGPQGERGPKGDKGERGETGKSIDIKLVDSLINRLNKLENNHNANADKYPDIPRKNLITSYKAGITLTTDTGVEAVESRNASTDFTPVESNTTYIIGLKNILDPVKALYRYGYYDSNKNLISMTSSTSFTDTNKSTTITTPSNAKYIRIVLNVTHKDEIYMNKGTIPYFELPALDPIDVISSDEEFNEYVEEFIDDHVQDSVYKYLASKPTQVVNANNLNKNIGTDVQAEQVFVQEMNKKMKQLGLSSTFANSTGLQNSGNLASAYDFNIIALHASVQPELASIWGQKHLDLYLRGSNPRTVSVDTSVTGASLENTYTILGGKTGTIGTLKNLTVIVANGDDIYVGTVMKASDDRFLDLKIAIDQAIKKDKGQTYDVNEVGTTDTTFSVIKYPKFNALLTTNKKPDLLLGKNQDTLNNPASMTKIITSIVCIENATNLNQPITFQSSDIVGGSGIAINVGDVMTLREAIYAMMLPSTNTAAKAVARVVGHNIINTRGYV